MKKFVKRTVLPALAVFVFALTAQASREAREAFLIGLDADMSSGSKESGEAIRRGVVLAVEEINRAGGVLGRPLRLVVRDHRGNPARGVDNIKELASMENLVAVVGGLHTPVALEELDVIHSNEVVYLSPWAAGTPIAENGRKPNFVFRVSVRDDQAGEFLVEKAVRMNYLHPALLLERTGWGKSNERAMVSAIRARGLWPAHILWFHWGVSDLTDTLERASSSGADVILLAANAPEGIAVVRSMARLPKELRLPIISHWGITGGDFFDQTRGFLSEVDLVFLQTFSFLDPPYPRRARAVVDAYLKSFPDSDSARDIFSPAGTAHAYDLVHILAMAIEKAGTAERPAVRDALENLGPYEGLVRRYDPPFTARDHDALDASDMCLARYESDGTIVPVTLR